MESRPSLKARRLSHKKLLLSSNDETLYANKLKEIEEQSNFGVKIGSYPQVPRPDCKAVITVEGEGEEAVEKAVEALRKALPKGAVVGVETGDNLLSPV
eukprot:CAMPEP_0170191658 /NCGR_PEP_ID=MMETSP0040_2-20121228/52229_1 /TAXON_ID=641309 /ORGANISM="Lotharella oceanica, Strain CCMP622" /LENGTH=98 /DNA_ID=CAMNT_0010439799 /DNA_START=174 /DNA_END=467 /DNA_ORIENTATION=+